MTFPARIDLKDASTFPSRRVEEWKYTDLRKLLRETPPAASTFDAVQPSPFAPLAAPEIVFTNGVRQTPEVIGPFVTEDTFIADGERQLRFISRGDGTGHQCRLKITVEPGKALTLFESYEGSGAYVSNVALDITLGEGARLERIVLTDEPDTAISLARADVTLSARATFIQTTLTAGARLLRQETHVAHPGAGAFVHIDGLYVLADKRHSDLTSTVIHVGGDGVTSQLAKGVVKDEARGVFQGQIVVREGADGTDARMGHHALILSDRGEVDAKPELEIYADDVQCAHGNTVGALDESALFYMRSRGIPEAQARALLTEAFLAEVTDRIEREDVRDLCRAWLAERMA